ncbi:MAG TPA: hypothetical protein VMV47_08725 [Bacteroidales bacterium]|nr:hypothetical protein [Bacteroidales bacterium]
MKPSISIPRIRNIFLTLASAMMIFSFGQCAAQADFLISSVVPAARGSVTVNKDKYNNYIMEIEITNLSEASRLSPPMNTYVVWMVTDENITKNIGQIRTTTSFISRKLKASFETKSAFRPVKIFITAEYDPNLQYSNREVVLTTDNFNLPKI